MICQGSFTTKNSLEENYLIQLSVEHDYLCHSFCKTGTLHEIFLRGGCAYQNEINI